MSSRPDQLRDNDAIQRDCIRAKLSRGVIVAVSHHELKSKAVVVLDLIEPNTSSNALSPKFSFRVEEETPAAAFNSLGQVLDDAVAAFKNAREAYQRKNP